MRAPDLSLLPYAGAMLMTALLTVLAAPLKDALGLVNIAMLYLVPVLFSAVKWGTYPAVVTALTAVLTFDFFLVPTVKSFTVLDIRYIFIQDIIGVAVNRIDEQLSNRPLKIEIELDMSLVHVDFVLIEQVLVNLLDNALKYSESGSEIILSARQKGRQLEVSVSDRGHEIPMEDRERIFDKFYRLRSPGLVSGTGLGLAICRGFIEAHGGRIWAEPNPVGGEVFTFTLPMAEKGPVNIPVVK